LFLILCLNVHQCSINIDKSLLIIKYI
jgi:hypothetical protein